MLFCKKQAKLKNKGDSFVRKSARGLADIANRGNGKSHTQAGFVILFHYREEWGDMVQKRLELRISPWVAVILALMVVTDRSGVCLVTLIAALLHELGHLLAARLLKIPLGELRLGFLGARIEVRGRMLSYGEEWLLCAAGPLTSLAFAAAGSLFWQVWQASRLFSCASLVLGILNLLPIRTFDGGRMLECLLSACLGERALETVMRLCSFSFLLALWGISVYFLLRAGDGLSMLCFSMSLFFRFFEGGGEKKGRKQENLKGKP